MIKLFFKLFVLFLLTGCATSGTALLGPAFTGFKTGSVYQASISYSTNLALTKLKNLDNTKKSLSLNNNYDPIILTSFKVIKVEISQVEVPEPLP
tara:strand:+ start:843 stop:1127 length:285 start_codon:yes stop_codon:yes gene_type:complete